MKHLDWLALAKVVSIGLARDGDLFRVEGNHVVAYFTSAQLRELGREIIAKADLHDAFKGLKRKAGDDSERAAEIAFESLGTGETNYFRGPPITDDQLGPGIRQDRGVARKGREQLNRQRVVELPDAFASGLGKSFREIESEPGEPRRFVKEE